MEGHCLHPVLEDAQSENLFYRDQEVMSMFIL